MKKWNSLWIGNIPLAIAFVIDCAAGLFHFFHRVWLWGASDFMFAGSCVGVGFLLARARRRRDFALDEMRRVHMEMMARQCMTPTLKLDAQRIAMETLKRIAPKVGAHLTERQFSAPTPYDPAGICLDSQIEITIGKFKYVIVHGQIYRQHIESGYCSSTCYHPKDALPPADCMLSALLLLKNDPTIFDRWARQDAFYS